MQEEYANMQASPSQHLTRKQMESVIDSGGSVMYNGRIIAHKHVLPSEAQLAAGNPAMEKEATVLLTDEIAKLNAQLAALKDGTFSQKFGVPPASSVGPSVFVQSPMDAPTPSIPDDLKAAQRAAVLAGAPESHNIAPLPPITTPTHPNETAPATPAVAAPVAPAPSAPAAAVQPEPSKAKK